jgi:hypothetical protein
LSLIERARKVHPGQLNKVSAAVAITAAVLAGCGANNAEAEACANADGALSDAAVIFVTDPPSGERVGTGFSVMGCSSTFEASVNWRLRGRDGRVLASGVTQGGSLQPNSFEFRVEYTVNIRQIGELEVYEPRVTSEGFPPPRDVVPLVLKP